MLDRLVVLSVGHKSRGLHYATIISQTGNREMHPYICPIWGWIIIIIFHAGKKLMTYESEVSPANKLIPIFTLEAKSSNNISTDDFFLDEWKLTDFFFELMG